MTDFNTQLTEVIENHLKVFKDTLFTSEPARILKYNPSTQKADVQPLVNFLFSNGTSREMPTIYSVPVMFPSTGRSAFTFPLAVGDTVLLVYSQKPLNPLLSTTSTGTVTPRETGAHKVNDAIAIPGFSSFPTAPNDPLKHTLIHDTDDLVISHNLNTPKENEVRLKKDGTIRISSGGKSKLTLNLDGTVTLDADVLLTVNAPNTTWIGDINQQGSFTSDTEVTANGVKLSDHVHSGVQTGGSSTGGPT